MACLLVCPLPDHLHKAVKQHIVHLLHAVSLMATATVASVFVNRILYMLTSIMVGFDHQ